MGTAQIRAAGGVLWRRARTGVEVLVVHRDRYDDWTFPKGKLDPGETWADAAVREVQEETGFEPDVGPELAETTYVDHNGRTKKVRYWAMTVPDGDGNGAFVPNDEVDDIAWVTPTVARGMLTYSRDGAVVDSLVTLIGSPDL